MDGRVMMKKISLCQRERRQANMLYLYIHSRSMLARLADGGRARVVEGIFKSGCGSGDDDDMMMVVERAMAFV